MRRGLVALAALTLLAGCRTVGPDYAPPAAPVAPAFRGAPPPSPARAARPPEAWWTGFGDPVLTATVEQALAGSPTVEAAVARVTQARAASRAAGAALYPTGQLQVDVTHARQSLVGQNAFAAAVRQDVDIFAAGVGAAWEADLFGGLRREREASRADAEGAVLALAGARLMVAADTAGAYLQLRGLQARIALVARRVRDDRRLVELTGLLFDAGRIPRLQLDQARATLAQAEASEPLLRAAAEAQLNRLAVLTGRTPESERGALAVERPVPPPPPVPADLAPADLLRARPDVAAAERRLAAANARIGTAIADYYPRVSFQGLLGLQSIGLGDFLTGDAGAGSLAAGLRWRLFDFGRVDAEVANARGVYAEALADWRAAVLRAAEEVETALAVSAERARQLDRLQAASLSLERALDASQAGYDRGVVSLLDVIDTERQLLITQDAAADANAQRARAAVAIRRALGG